MLVMTVPKGSIHFIVSTCRHGSSNSDGCFSTCRTHVFTLPPVAVRPQCRFSSSSKVAAAMKLMFNQPLTDRVSKVLVAFSSDNPPLDLSCRLISDYILLDDNQPYLLNLGGFLEVVMDMILSDDDDDDDAESARLTRPNAPNKLGCVHY
jgi:hypothetical protein